MRVLVVEPSQDARTALLAMLSERRLPAQAAGSATTALAIAGWFRPTVILLALNGLTVDPATFATLVRDGRLDRVVILGVAAAPPHAAGAQGLDDIIAYPRHADDVQRAVERVRGAAEGA